MKKNIILFIIFLCGLFMSNAQSVLEFAAGAGNPTANGPTVANQVITFQKNTNNPSWSSFAFVLFLNLYLLVVLYFKYFSLILWFERCAP